MMQSSKLGMWKGYYQKWYIKEQGVGPRGWVSPYKTFWATTSPPPSPRGTRQLMPYGGSCTVVRTALIINNQDRLFYNIFIPYYHTHIYFLHKRQKRGRMLHHGFQRLRNRRTEEARVFDMFSQMKQEEIIQWHVFSGIALFHELCYISLKCKCLISDKKNMFHLRWNPGWVLLVVFLGMKIHPAEPNGRHLLAFYGMNN